MKSFDLFLLSLLFCSTSFAQLDVKYLVVPGLNSNAQISSFINLPNGNNLIATNQTGNSFFIEADYMGNYITSTNFQSTILEVKLCSDNGFFILFANYTIIKMDSSFNISWTKKLSPLNSSYSLIGTQHVAESDGYYYLFTCMEDSVFNPGVGILSTFDLVLFKFDSLGNLIKHNIITDQNHTSNSYNRYSRSLTTGKNCLYAGLSLLNWSAGGTCNYIPAIMKIDTSLSVLWTHNYQASVFNSMTGLRDFADGNLLLYGIRSDNYPHCTLFRPYIVKTDSSGNVLLSRDYYFSVPAECNFNDLVINPDSTAALSLKYTDISSGIVKFILARVDETGQLINATEINSAHQSNHPELKIVRNSNGLLNICQVYNTDTLILFTEDNSFSGSCLNVPVQVYDSASNASPGLIDSYYIPYNFSFADTSVTPVQPPAITSEIFCTTLGENIIADKEDIRIFPNPSAENISIRSDKNIMDLQISDLSGKIIYHSNPNQMAITLTIQESGLYVVKLTTATSVIVKKIQLINIL